ncbi:MAG: ATP-binding protein [Amaricoccus sp.]
MWPRFAERARRRIARHLAEARLPPGKTLDAFDFDPVPMLSRAQVMALVAGDSWLEKGDNLLVFGPPGAGKSHLADAIGLGLIENGWRWPDLADERRPDLAIRAPRRHPPPLARGARSASDW